MDIFKKNGVFDENRINVKAVCNSFCFGKSDTVNRYKPKLIFSYGYY